MKSNITPNWVTPFILILLLLFQFKDLHAQYTTSAGIRIGGTTGISAKHFYRADRAVEGIIGGFGNGFSVTGLIEKFAPVYDTRGLYVFYGGGIHLAFYNGKSDPGNFGRDIDYRKNSDVGFGMNGIVGIEYRLPDNFPMAFTLDLKPFIEMSSGARIAGAVDPSLGIRFIIQ